MYYLVSYEKGSYLYVFDQVELPNGSVVYSGKLVKVLKHRNVDHYAPPAKGDTGYFFPDRIISTSESLEELIGYAAMEML